MSVIGLAAGMMGHGALGAYQSMDFGRKGLLAGGAIGAAGYLAGESIDDGGLGGALVSGMITGSVQSAFSTAQELYAFKNPNHVSAMSSINTTTTATSIAGGVYDTIKGPNRSKAMFANALTPQNIMTDLTRMAMISGDMSTMNNKMAEAFGLDPNTGEKLNKSGNSLKRAFDFAKGHIKDNLDAADSKSPWFSKEATSFDIETNNPNYQRVRVLDESGNWVDKPGSEPRTLKKTISLTGKESMGQRAAMFVEANGQMYDDLFKDFGELHEMVGLKGDGFAVKDHKQYAEYLRSMNGGAVDTMESLHKAGYGGKGSSTLKRMIGLGVETYSGSPAWARVTAKQMKDGTITNTEAWTDAEGNHRRRMIADVDGKVHIKGGGKWGRVAALAGDIAMGGLLNAGLNAVIYGASSPFRGKSDQAVNSNKAYNPI